MKSQRTATTALYQDASVKKDGTQTIYLRLTIDRKIKAFPTGIAILSKYWDKDRQQVKVNVKGLSNAREIAASLAQQKAGLDKLILDLQSRGEAVTISSVERRMESGSRTKLIDYCIWRRDCEAHQRAAATIETYDAQIGVLRKFDPHVEISGITTRWLESYKEWLFARGCYRTHTIFFKLAYVHKIVRYAVKNGDLESDPFENFTRVKLPRVEKQYLTKPELTKLLEMYQGGAFRSESLPASFKKGSRDSLHNCLQQFLASCFSGLRFSDIGKLKKRDFQESHLSIVMKKTKDPLRIPINAPLRSVLNLDADSAGVFNGRTVSNVHMNSRLETIMELAGIDKHITFHCARHTFAIMALEVGMPIEVVSHILGHRSLSVTQVYARIVDSHKAREMAKMDVFLSTKSAG